MIAENKILQMVIFHFVLNTDRLGILKLEYILLVDFFCVGSLVSVIYLFFPVVIGFETPAND